MKEIVGYMFDAMEFPTVEFLNKLEELRSKYISFGIGVYTDEMFEKLYGRKPLKPYAEREQMAKAFKGVDFTFKVKSINCENENGNNSNEKNQSKKKYHVGYAPGTYDLLHEGHMEHLGICRDLCDILVVGVKTDKNVKETKGKETYQNQNVRKRVIENLSLVDYVILVDTRNKIVANKKVKELTGEQIDVVFLGSDCIGQENDQNPDGLKFIFTDRPAEVMKTRSSSYYRKLLTSRQ